MIVVSLFAGPGAGKSTMAAGVFYKLKTYGINAELVTEYAKDLTWEKRHKTLSNQAYVFGKQLQRIHRLENQVQVVITDSPLALTLLYTPEDYPESFKPFVLDMIAKYDNMNYLVKRVKEYQPIGRNQTKDQADQLDIICKALLDNNALDYTEVMGDETGMNKVFADILDRMYE